MFKSIPRVRMNATIRFVKLVRVYIIEGHKKFAGKHC